MQTLVDLKRPKRKPKSRENLIEQSILQYLEFLPGCYAWKNHTTGYFDTRTQTFKKQKSKYAINGVSDILGIYKGKLLAIEVKDPQNKSRTDSQNKFIETITRYGGLAFYATSVDEVKEKLVAV